MRRILSGISGLDRLLEGGFPEGSAILVTGEPGTGKTLFGLQYLYNGCSRYDEPGVLIQAGEFNSTIYWYEEMMRWNLADMQDKNKLMIYAFKPTDYDKFLPESLESEVLSKLRNILVPMHVKRAVIDAITPLSLGMDLSRYRKSLYLLISFMKELGVTSVLISESSLKEQMAVEEHICDGVIRIKHEIDETGQYNKRLLVAKMVATNAPMAWYPVTISSRLGFSVRPFL
ncbi:MAG: hypothetical protein J7K68_04240 [Candidatus Diapherotrites archaeon]|nr:hypothetical protein [Candidatus Diapherotrites archaeon]